MKPNHSEDNIAPVVVPAPAPAFAAIESPIEAHSPGGVRTGNETHGSGTTSAAGVLEFSAPTTTATPAPKTSPPPATTAPAAIAPSRVAVMMAMAKLRPHPENTKIYGEKESIDDLCESIRRNNTGILEPLLITKDGRIIGGHRRHRAAVKLEILEVPVRVFESNDETEILNALLEHNRHRIKSKAQIAAEAILQMRIEKERPAKRKASGNVQVEKLPRMVRGKARDAAGKVLGLSGRTVEKAAKVSEGIANLRTEGKSDAADRIEKALNKSYDTGYRAAVNEGVIVPKKRPKKRPKVTTAPPTEVPPTITPAFELVPESVPLPITKIASGPSGSPTAKSPISVKLDSDSAMTKADDVLTFLRSPAAKHLSAQQKKDWGKLLDQFQTCRTGLSI